ISGDDRAPLVAGPRIHCGGAIAGTQRCDREPGIRAALYGIRCAGQALPRRRVADVADRHRDGQRRAPSAQRRTDAGVLPVRRRIWRVDGNRPVLPLPGMEHIVGEARSPVRFGLTLMGTFALLALIVAAVGLYAVVAYGASSRAHEIGVRVALGATRHDIRR